MTRPVHHSTVKIGGCLFGTLFAASSAAHAQVVINEVDYDQPSTDTAEFVELKNVGASAVDLSAYTLRLVNGANGGAAAYQNFVLPAVILGPNQYFVVCANAATVANCNLDVSPNTDLIQNGAPDALALVLNGSLGDAVSYEGLVPGYIEGASAPTDTALAVESLSRCADGRDSGDNGADFQLRPATPGVTNNCGGGGGVLGSCGEPATVISAIQGSGLASPLVGQTRIIEGVVVADFQDGTLNGFYVQEDDSDSDGNVLTSEGIFVFNGSSVTNVNAGERVRVVGDIAELAGLTELTNIQVATCPGTALATSPVVTLPVSAIADLERFEGMRVSFPQTLTVTGNYDWGRFGSLDLSVGGRLYTPTQIAAPGTASTAQQDLNDRSRIVLDDVSSAQDPNPIPYKSASNSRRTGSSVANLVGILDDRFGAYRVEPTLPPAFTEGNPAPAAPSKSGRLRVSPFNVLNFFSDLDTGTPICGPTGGLDCRGANSAAELSRQLQKLSNALIAIDADIFGLTEIENNTSAASQMLVDTLNARVGAGTYTFLNTGSIGTDAIKLAFLYKPAKVTPVAAFKLLTSAVDARFVDTRNRPALAQTFRETSSNGVFTIVLNHLKSKGSSCGAGDDDSSLGGQGNCNVTRANAASALLDWIATDPTHSNDPDIMLMGDLNAYAMEDPIVLLRAGGLVNLDRDFGGGDVYSYQFDGQWGTLDYAFANTALRAQVAGAQVWHANSDEPIATDYNLEFRTDDLFNAENPYRASDHDPVVVDLNLTPGQAPTPVPAAQGFQLLLSALGLLGAGAWRSRAGNARKARAQNTKVQPGR